MTVPFILASVSLDRKELLKQLVPDFEVKVANVYEPPFKYESQKKYAQRMAFLKAKKVYEDNSSSYVLAADTSVFVGRKMLGVPYTEFLAEACVKLFSGRVVCITTGLCLITPEGKCIKSVSQNRLKFMKLSDSQVRKYIDDDSNWHNFTGGFHIDHSKIEPFIVNLTGTVSGLKGLPLYETAKLLHRAGYTV